MLTLSLVPARSPPADPVDAQPRNLAAGALLNMPEPLVHDTGLFVFAQVQAFENRCRQVAVPDAAAASAPLAAPPIRRGDPPTTHSHQRRTCHDPLRPLFLRRALARRRHLQRRLGRRC